MQDRSANLSLISVKVGGKLIFGVQERGKLMENTFTAIIKKIDWGYVGYVAELGVNK